jgi:RNA polymerase sigma factor (sigma-70 family)
MIGRLQPAANSQGPFTISVIRRRFGRAAPLPARDEPWAQDALAVIYDEQSRPLLGLAALLVQVAVRPAAPVRPEVLATAEYSPGPASSTALAAAEFAAMEIPAMPAGISDLAEEIVHDAFAAMHREWRRLRDNDSAVAYLRHTIVRVTRDRARASRASQDAALSARSALVLAALRRLPGRQREALVLRYYANLPEAQAAAAMGVTRAAFRGHAAKGMTALRDLLDE